MIVKRLRADELRGVEKVLFSELPVYGLVATIYFVKDQKPITVTQLVFWELCRYFRYDTEVQPQLLESTSPDRGKERGRKIPDLDSSKISGT